MKRNLQEKQWAEKLKEWEASTSSQTWDRPSEGGWDRIAESLPTSEKKPFFVWWKPILLILAFIGVGSISYVYFSQNQYSSDTTSKIVDISTQSLGSKNLNEFSTKEKNEQQPKKIPVSANSDKYPSINLIENSPIQSNRINEENSSDNKDHNLLNTNKSSPLSSTKLSTKLYLKENQKEQVIGLVTKTSLIQNDSSETQKPEGIPQAFIEPIDDKPLEAQTLSSGEIASQVVTLNIETTHEFTLEQSDNPSLGSITNHESQLIPTLAFFVQTKGVDLEMTPSLVKAKSSIWSVDIYAQYSLQSSFRPQSPIWRLQKEKNQSYGMQINRTIGKRLNAHIGIQKRSEQYKINGAFLRVFNSDNEDSMGRSTFRLSTSIGDEKNIEEDVIIQRNAGQVIPLGSRLSFRVEREITVKMISVPIGLSYTFWQSYPFRLSGVLGGEFTRVKIKTERKKLSFGHLGLSVRDIITRNNSQVFVEKDFSLQAGLRLDVHLTPNVKTMVQLDWQNARQKGRGVLSQTGNQVRLGVSYNL